MYDLSFASFCLLNIPYWDVKPSCADARDAAAGLTDKKKKCWNCSRSISCQEQKRVAFDLISRVNNPGPR